MPAPTTPYTEIAEGIDEEGELGSTRCVRRFQVDWERRWEFAEQAFGFIRSSNGIFLRGLPWEYPYRPGLYPRRFRFKPKGKHFGLSGGFQWCHVEIEFSEPEFHDSETDGSGSTTLYSIQAVGNPEFRTIPDSQLTFTSDGKPVGQAVAVHWPSQAYNLTLHRVPFFPRGFLKGIVGRCNQSGVTIGGEFFPAETLLLKSWSANREITFSGEGIQIPAWTVNLDLLECDYGFNKLLRPDTGVIEGVSPADGIIRRSNQFDRLIWLVG